MQYWDRGAILHAVEYVEQTHGYLPSYVVARLKFGCLTGVGLDFEIGRKVPAVCRKLGQNLLVKPNVHRSRVVGVASVVQLLCKFLARA